jgi:Papain-like cysteine protease AvrRpt2
MAWRTLENVTVDAQPDATSCWLSAAKAILDALNVKCPSSVEEMRNNYKGKGEEDVGKYSVTVGVGDPVKVLGDYGLPCEKIQDKKWDESDADKIFARLDDAIGKNVPVLCGITSPQHTWFKHAVVIKGTNDAFKEVLYADPKDGLMKVVKIQKLIVQGFLYRKPPRIDMKTGAKKAPWEIGTDAYAYAYMFAFPKPLASRI